MLTLVLPQRLSMPTDATLTHASHMYTPVDVESIARSRVLSVTTIASSGPVHMKEGVAAKLSTTEAVQVMDKTRPQRPSLSGTPIVTAGEGAAGEGELISTNLIEEVLKKN